ncbi:hypothetical protein O181_120035 [Austropuccinia psidii MF-1]|uniref:Uncharacterized protein n=1 Tax=Austropuccinia psidii MF-1 TaxID=1389203 RepID=A0A9Q3KF27_9BASI|nr:hypothetical protein [Austropuccinia psidii MF-1]
MCQHCSTQKHSSAAGDRQGVAFTPFNINSTLKSSNQPLHPNLFQTSLLLHQDLSACRFYWIKSSQLIIHNLPKALSPLQHYGTPFGVGLDNAVLEGEITGKQF